MKFKYKFNVPSNDFKKRETVELVVETNPETFEELSGTNAEMQYKIKIPDYIYNELVDTEPKYASKADDNNRATISGCFPTNSPLYRKFQKTQTSTSLHHLYRYLSDLVSELNEKYSDEFISKKKKIFIKYNHSSVHSTNGYNGAYMGKTVKNYFQFFIGYETIRNMDSDSIQGRIFKPSEIDYITHIEFHPPSSSTRKKDSNFLEDNRNIKLAGGKKPSDFASEYSIIDWTEEREAFCKQIQDTFEKINTDLASFLTDLNNDKFDLLITNNPLKLLN